MSKTRQPKPVKKETKTPRATSSSGASNPSEMSEIRDLIDFISKTGLNEVNIETKDLKLHVKREPDQKILKSSAPVVTSVAPVTSAPQVSNAPAKSESAASIEGESTGSSGKKAVEIKSPMIGTFYRSANPDSPPFVSVGDKISKGQTVCIIEAMKLFNEIESEVSGTIVKAAVENATPVEYDQVLFLVEPD